MIANSASPYPGGVPHPFTLNDLRVHNTVAEGASSTSALALSGLAAAVLAIGAFIWLDPLHLFAPTQAGPPTQASVPSGEPARPTERQEIVAPLTPVPATKSVDALTAPAPVVQAPQIPAPVARPRAASSKPESRGNPMDKANTTVARATPIEKAAPPAPLAEPEAKAPPVLVAKPEEKTDAPSLPKLGDDTKNAPKPAVTNDQAPVPE